VSGGARKKSSKLRGCGRKPVVKARAFEQTERHGATKTRLEGADGLAMGDRIAVRRWSEGHRSTDSGERVPNCGQRHLIEKSRFAMVRGLVMH